MVKFTQGDDVLLDLRALSGKGVPLDLTGATLTTYLPKTDGSQLEVGSAAHTIDPNQTINKGKFVVELTAEQTALISTGANLSIMTKILQSGRATHCHGKQELTVLTASVV